MQRLRPLNRGDWSGGKAEVLRDLGVTSVLVHAGLFVDNPEVGPTQALAERGLARNGFERVLVDGSVTLWVRR
jgi:hypothetical protein